MRSVGWGSLAALVGILAVGGAQAQERPVDPAQDMEAKGLRPPHKLININTPLLPAKGRLFFDFNARPFGGQQETNAYYFLEGQYGLTENLSVFARGGGARKGYFVDGANSIPNGGTEYEIGGKLRLPSVGAYEMAVEGSVTWAQRLDNTRFFPSAQFIASRKFGERTTLYFAPKAIFGSRALITLGGGVHYRLDNQWELFGDIQGPILGENVYRTSDFSRVGSEVWGVGVRYAPRSLNGRASIDLGVTNGLGRTTNFSASPGLSGNSAFYVNITFRN